tara:strand:- start:1048 stop:1335 length:288 start_codon:yes stop_codon:yes gene_type:complete
MDTTTTNSGVIAVLTTIVQATFHVAVIALRVTLAAVTMCPALTAGLIVGVYYNLNPLGSGQAMLDSAFPFISGIGAGLMTLLIQSKLGSGASSES